MFDRVDAHYGYGRGGIGKHDPKETGYYAAPAHLNRLGTLVADVTLLRYRLGLRMTVSMGISDTLLRRIARQNLLCAEFRPVVCTQLSGILLRIPSILLVAIQMQLKSF